MLSATPAPNLFERALAANLIVWVRQQLRSLQLAGLDFDLYELRHRRPNGHDPQHLEAPRAWQHAALERADRPIVALDRLADRIADGGHMVSEGLDPLV